jgi:hypothetical protein
LAFLLVFATDFEGVLVNEKSAFLEAISSFFTRI